MTSSMNFVKGVSIGFIAGTAIGVAVAPTKRSGKSVVGRTLKTMGDAVDNICDTFSK